MGWVDFKRFTLALLAFSVLDGTVGVLLGFTRDETRNVVLAIGFAIIGAIRDRQSEVPEANPGRSCTKHTSYDGLEVTVHGPCDASCSTPTTKPRSAE